MLVIKIELWPLGDGCKAETLGVAKIVNDGTGTRSVGNYTLSIFRKGSSKVLKSGRISGFPRLRKGPWELLMLCLASAYLKVTEKSDAQQETAQAVFIPLEPCDDLR